MRLLEFQGKELLSAYGIKILKGLLIEKADDALNLPFPCVLKAQVPVGGRGKAGAIASVDGPEQAVTAARRILAATVKGWPVSALLAEQLAPAGREIYLSLLVDGRSGDPVILASAKGGMDIEETARQDPDAVLRRPIDPFLGVRDYDVRAIARHIGTNAKKLSPVLQSLWVLFRSADASLVEINPLLETDTEFLALDAKIILDNPAGFRHGEDFKRLSAEAARLDTRPRTASERLAEAGGITYVPLQGDVGLIADGAGTGMLTLDLIHSEGGSAANFCEMGGLSNAPTMCETLRMVLADDRLRVVVVSLIGGMTRMDDMAQGVLDYLKTPGVRQIPLVVRMCGTKADVGIPMLREAGVAVFEDLVSAVREAVKPAGRK